MPRVCIVAVVLLSASCAAWAGSARTAIPRAVNPPTLDGRLDDWQDLPQVAMADASDWHPAASEFATYGGPQDVSAEVRAVWDSRNLYLSIETRDDTLVRVKSASEINRGDSVVLALTGEGSEQVNQFVIALLKGASLVWRSEPAAGQGEAKLIERAIWARADEGGGWRVTYELSIPWSELAGIRPIAGGGFALTMSACDDDDAGLKGCLERAAVVELSGTPVAALATPTPAPVDRPALAPAFLVPDAVRYEQHRLLLRGRETVLLGGLVDYTRLPKAAWANRLDLLKAAGFNTVGITVPWAHHQPSAGEVDLVSLHDVLRAVSQTGLWAQVAVGPFAGEASEAGGVPGWYLGLDTAARQAANDDWMKAVCAVVKEYQISADGPVVAVLIRPLPDARGESDAISLAHLASLARSAGIEVPILTANLPTARDNTRQTLANLLDTVSFYEPPALAELSAMVRGLAADENGPAIISALPGRYLTPQTARANADAVRVALAAGAGAIILSDFALGVDPTDLARPGETSSGGVVSVMGAPTAGEGEMRLVADFLRLFGPQLARALPAEEVLRSDDREVKTATRLGERTGFVFLWSSSDSSGPHRVHLTYHEPGTTAVISIPSAGAITLPTGGAKILPLDVPVGRGLLRYATSEVAGLYTIADRTVLVIYGDRDTPGEIALRWPGPPLVVGEVLRQEWNPDTTTLTLDYYHKQQDQWLLVDDLQIAVLARDRATTVADIGETLVLSAGVRVSDGATSPEGARALLHVPTGTLHATAAVPDEPAAVLVDAEPVPFSYGAPARVLEFTLTTDTFEKEREPSSRLERLGRSVLGGPPKLYTSFDRAQFRPDDEAPGTKWIPVGPLGRGCEALGLETGDFARLRTRVDPEGRTRLVITGSSDPTLVFVNGRLVTFETSGPDREADVAALLVSGENEISLLVQLLPRERGVAGLRGPGKRLPILSLRGEAGDLTLDRWEVSPGLAGEAAGWADVPTLTGEANVLRLGPWREQGARYQQITGVGWYLFPFSLPKPDKWEIPYEARLTLTGSAQLYLNGVKLATLLGSGSYAVPLPSPPLADGGDNLLAVALYDPAGQPALDKVEIAAIREAMTRQQRLEIKF